MEYPEGKVYQFIMGESRYISLEDFANSYYYTSLEIKYKCDRECFKGCFFNTSNSPTTANCGITGFMRNETKHILVERANNLLLEKKIEELDLL